MGQLTKSEIENKFDVIKYKMGRLEEEIDQLKPQVLQHFNEYIDRVINNEIPEGYRLPPSKVCFYNDDGFNPWTAPHLQLSPGEFSRGPFQFERIIVKLRDEYVEETPWVSHVNINFSLSR